jgi:hypothetical protein
MSFKNLSKLSVWMPLKVGASVMIVISSSDELSRVSAGSFFLSVDDSAAVDSVSGDDDDEVVVEVAVELDAEDEVDDTVTVSNGVLTGAVAVVDDAADADIAVPVVAGSALLAVAPLAGVANVTGGVPTVAVVAVNVTGLLVVLVDAVSVNVTDLLVAVTVVVPIVRSVFAVSAAVFVALVDAVSAVLVPPDIVSNGDCAGDVGCDVITS